MLTVAPALLNQDGISINEVAESVQAGRIRSIKVTDDTQLQILFRDGRFATSTKEQFVALPELLQQLGVTEKQMTSFEYRVETSSNLTNILFNILLTVAPLGIV